MMASMGEQRRQRRHGRVGNQWSSPSECAQPHRSATEMLKSLELMSRLIPQTWRSERGQPEHRSRRRCRRSKGQPALMDALHRPVERLLRRWELLGRH